MDRPWRSPWRNWLHRVTLRTDWAWISFCLMWLLLFTAVGGVRWWVTGDVRCIVAECRIVIDTPAAPEE